MSADNGIFIILDKDKNGVVLNTHRSYIYELLGSDANPWIIDVTRWAQVHYLTAGHTVYKGIDKTMKRAVKELKNMETCEYGIVTIPVEITFQEAEDRYFRFAEESMKNVTCTKKQRAALNELTRLSIFRDILLYPKDMDFVTIFNRVENCYRVLKESRDKEWISQTEAWLRTYEKLL